MLVFWQNNPRGVDRTISRTEEKKPTRGQWRGIGSRSTSTMAAREIAALQFGSGSNGIDIAKSKLEERRNIKAADDEARVRILEAENRRLRVHLNQELEGVSMRKRLHPVMLWSCEFGTAFQMCILASKPLACCSFVVKHIPRLHIALHTLDCVTTCMSILCRQGKPELSTNEWHGI